MRITHAMLKRMGACSEQRERFKDLFPNGGALNRENIAKAYDNGLDVLWLILSLHLNKAKSNEVFAEWLKTSDDSFAEADKISSDFHRGLISEDEKYRLHLERRATMREKRIDIATEAFNDMVATGQVWKR